ncbi:MAG: hypothetical protein P8124_13030 [Gammaproteobacteria bacterium]
MTCTIRSASRSSSRLAALVCTAALAVAAAPQAGAVTITTNFISSGSYGGLTFESTAGTTYGGGTLGAIMNQAVSYWEAALPDSGNLTVNYGWSALGSTTLGETATSGSPGNAPTSAYIGFTNNSGIGWFFDSTPGSNSEYGTFTATSHNYGGGPMNKGRVYTGATGAASGHYDMLTVMEHELGHALGFYGVQSKTLDVTSPLPYAGSALPVNHDSSNTCPSSGCDHLNIGSAVMYYSIPKSERKLLTDADIVGVAQLRGDKNVSLAPVPLPASAPLMLSGLVGLLGWAGRRRRTA